MQWEGCGDELIGEDTKKDLTSGKGILVIEGTTMIVLFFFIFVCVCDTVASPCQTVVGTKLILFLFLFSFNIRDASFRSAAR